jgi:hypothetical protein
MVICTACNHSRFMFPSFTELYHDQKHCNTTLKSKYLHVSRDNVARVHTDSLANTNILRIRNYVRNSKLPKYCLHYQLWPPTLWVHVYQYLHTEIPSQRYNFHPTKMSQLTNRILAVYTFYILHIFKLKLFTPPGSGRTGNNFFIV